MRSLPEERCNSRPRILRSAALPGSGFITLGVHYLMQLRSLNRDLIHAAG
jgi:hypothetical protein